MTRILAIDPGSARSGWVVYDPDARPQIQRFGLDPNDRVLAALHKGAPVDVVALEWTAPRGMPASAELFETMWWAGRFTEASERAGVAIERVQRSEVKRHLCGNSNAKDSNVTAALIERYGGIGGKAAAVGLKASPGPLYGIVRDVWQALAVAITKAEVSARNVA